MQNAAHDTTNIDFFFYRFLVIIVNKYDEKKALFFLPKLGCGKVKRILISNSLLSSIYITFKYNMEIRMILCFEYLDRL